MSVNNSYSSNFEFPITSAVPETGKYEFPMDIPQILSASSAPSAVRNPPKFTSRPYIGNIEEVSNKIWGSSQSSVDNYNEPSASQNYSSLYPPSAPPSDDIEPPKKISNRKIIVQLRENIEQARSLSNSILDCRYRRYDESSGLSEAVSSLGRALINILPRQNSYQIARDSDCDSDREFKRNSIAKKDCLVIGLVASAVMAVCISPISKATNELGMADDGLEKVSTFEGKFKTLGNGPLRQKLEQITTCEKNIFQRMKSSANQKKNLCIATLASSAFLILGALSASKRATFGVASMRLGALGLLGSTIMGVAVSISSAFRRNESFNQASELQNHLDKLFFIK